MIVSIIITHYKTPEFLKLALRYAERACAGIESEIIVVDSDADDETKTLMREEFPTVCYIPFAANVGYAKLVNRGMEEARGDHFFIMNADVILNRHALTLLLDYLAHHPSTGMIGPRLLNFNGSYQPSCFRFYTPLTLFARRTMFGKTSWGKREINHFLMTKELALASHDKEIAIPVDWIMGSSIFTSRAAVRKVGLLDERFFMYFEDVDWCRRFWQNGYEVLFYPKAEVHHYHHRASKRRGGLAELLSNKQTRIHLVSAVKYFMKYGVRYPQNLPRNERQDEFSRSLLRNG